MKKEASARFQMWVMISLQTYLVIAAASMSESNYSTSVCNGSVEGCLTVLHLDSQLPTISSSPFRTMLDGSHARITMKTPNPDKPSVECRTDKPEKYHSCLAQAGGGPVINCGPYNRAC